MTEQQDLHGRTADPLQHGSGDRARLVCFTLTGIVRYPRTRGFASPGPGRCHEREVDIDLSMSPRRGPHRVDTVRGGGGRRHASRPGLSTCTNGRYEDLARFARVVRGKKVAVRTLVVPASRAVLARAIATGVLADIVDAGCAVVTPGCGPCLGAHAGVLGEGEVCLSTANRNFKNRMGVGGEIYLSSAATAAASALAGEIAVPEVV